MTSSLLARAGLLVPLSLTLHTQHHRGRFGLAGHECSQVLQRSLALTGKANRKESFLWCVPPLCLALRSGLTNGCFLLSPSPEVLLSPPFHRWGNRVCGKWNSVLKIMQLRQDKGGI